MELKYSTVYRNKKTGKFVRTQEAVNPEYIRFYGVTHAAGTWADKKGPLLSTTRDNFAVNYEGVGA